ncbi:polysaccharide biosynthesis protein [Candidatus Woesearchaeota archaeon]|nr:polysaccharide biosynthesis protein [Candidatus Woesearchaeota archaeon]
MFDNATILITGGTGSWGQELTKQLLAKYSPKEIRIYSRGEMKQVDMRIKFNNPRLKFIIGDVRDKTRLLTASKNVDYVFHLAAIKHVPVCEENPEEAILTNIIGTENLVFACIENNVKKMIDVSTDKAVDPLNLYGVTKACGEKITIAANQKTTDTVFACVRGGNVMGSRGSIIPLFRKQLATTNVLTVTDDRMTRFIFSLQDAIGLVLKSAEDSVGGEVFVMKMPSSTVIDIVNCLKEELGDSSTKVKMIGIRYGEKLDEVLVSRYEGQDRVIDDGDFYIILPFLDIAKTKKHYSSKKIKNIGEFNSRNARMLDMEEVRKLLKKNGFLEPVVKEKVPEVYFS